MGQGVVIFAERLLTCGQTCQVADTKNSKGTRQCQRPTYYTTAENWTAGYLDNSGPEVWGIKCWKGLVMQCKGLGGVHVIFHYVLDTFPPCRQLYTLHGAEMAALMFVWTVATCEFNSINNFPILQKIQIFKEVDLIQCDKKVPSLLPNC